jgi:hypothetical protein
VRQIESLSCFGMKIMLISIEWLSFFWSIWHNCNDKIWNDNARMPSQVKRVVFDHWNEWFVVHKMRSNYDHYVPFLSTGQREKPHIYRMAKMQCRCSVFCRLGKDSGGCMFP